MSARPSRFRSLAAASERRPGRRARALLAVACALGSCRAGDPGGSATASSGAGRPEASSAPVATALASPAAAPNPGPTAKAPPVPASPAVPPQLVACGKRDFYRVTDQALQVFEVAAVVPPAHIRGSSVARQTAEFEIEAPHNVVSFAPGSALVLAPGGLYRFDAKEARVRHHRVPSLTPPLHVWAASRRADAFWLRESAGKSAKRLVLRAPKGGGNPSDEGEAVVEEEAELVGFDGRWFAVLASDEWVHSTAEGLQRAGARSGRASLPGAHPEAALLFADAVPERYWSADVTGKLSLWSAQASQALKTAQVPGVVLDADVQGTQVAVLSLELHGQGYRPAVTILEDGEPRAHLSVGESSTLLGLPKLDLCLLPDRPWVVVGTRHWLQLLDWSSRRLLAEW